MGRNLPLPEEQKQKLIFNYSIMVPSTFQSVVSITHITTAALLQIDDVVFLTDPVFGKAGIKHDLSHLFPNTTEPIFTSSLEIPALRLDQPPHIDAILLSHEDHCDNLDPTGRQLLDGRKLVTTINGAKNLASRPGALGAKPWETQTHFIQGVEYQVTGTPCVHLPGGEVTGLILRTELFGYSTDDLPTAIWVSGDTIYLEELVEMKKKFHIVMAVVNLGAAKVEYSGASKPLLIGMGGNDAARLVREIGIGITVPVHYESWGHFYRVWRGVEEGL
ncbi:hypothetical protein ASPWEDRAFT_45366 [Aspergillus wentii DTO 134E9]|uniref:Metallo-beta-lactamase domain-containing protein n=1 Tax=Aspergillus wentii DTO 134E9 TaxID=1073089 RepID=A0A1L9R948_ASPWE|nr:uncharacterized protein ASPWEDRAFT_45366 [Aspergillus wentii DTO 134E9]OJJ31440.1 hypothetical protein ASPWEDRAFT_45366 [Aspergillus wentii DTO 134E9]